MEQQTNETSILSSDTTNRIFTIAFATAGFALAGLPCILGLLLFILNQEYIGRMIFSCESRGMSSYDLCSQPCGWMMIFTFAVIVGGAYLSLFGSSTFLKGKWRLIALITIFLLLIPALLVALSIILLGPAVLIIMETNF